MSLWISTRALVWCSHVQQLDLLMLETYLTLLSSALLIASKVLVYRTLGMAISSRSFCILLLLLLPLSSTSAFCCISWAGSEISLRDLCFAVQASWLLPRSFIGSFRPNALLKCSLRRGLPSHHMYQETKWDRQRWIYMSWGAKHLTTCALAFKRSQ